MVDYTEHTIADLVTRVVKLGGTVSDCQAEWVADEKQEHGGCVAVTVDLPRRAVDIFLSGHPREQAEHDLRQIGIRVKGGEA